MENIDKSRLRIAQKVREFRKSRHWTQAELSRRLHLSQSRLSELERGDGSFTAEQFLTLLGLFNATPSDFTDEPANNVSEVQNALARWGAPHLQQSPNVLPSARITAVGDAVREAIVASDSPRIITSLAPVLVRNVDRVNLQQLLFELARVGLERRLGWIIDNTLEAVRRETSNAPPQWRRLFGRAQVVLEPFLNLLAAHARRELLVPDALDKGIRSKQTFEHVRDSSSPLSRRWGIVTSIQPDDFVDALRGSYGAG